MKKYRSVYRMLVEFASGERVLDIAGVTPDLVDRYRLARREADREPKTIYNETAPDSPAGELCHGAGADRT